MNSRVIELRCPGCGAMIAMGQKECDWCHSPINISSFQSIYDMPMPEINKYAGVCKKVLAKEPDDIAANKSIAMCYLKLGLYDKAEKAFEKAIEDNFDDAEIYLYAAACLLKGKRPFMATRQMVDKAIVYLNAALMIEERGIFYHFRSYLKYDYYEMKRLHIAPDFLEDWKMAQTVGVSEMDRQQLFAMLGVQTPDGF